MVLHDIPYYNRKKEKLENMRGRERVKKLMYGHENVRQSNDLNIKVLYGKLDSKNRYH